MGADLANATKHFGIDNPDSFRLNPDTNFTERGAYGTAGIGEKIYAGPTHIWYIDKDNAYELADCCMLELRKFMLQNNLL